MPIINLYKPAQIAALQATTGMQARIINGKPMLVAVKVAV